MYKRITKTIIFIIWTTVFIGTIYLISSFNNGIPFEIPQIIDLNQDIQSVLGKKTENENKTKTPEETSIEIIEEKEGFKSSYIPVSIKIDSVNIDLPVKIGRYNPEDKTWKIGNNSAYWANLSNLPSENNGNTLIYGHNTSDSFYRLKDIENGDIAVIEAQTGEILTYEYIGDEIVEPQDDLLFYKNDIPRLTLLTCSGSFSQVRRLMYFKLKSIENAVE